MTKDLAKVVKKALAAEYGFKNVRVGCGRGTAAGWVEARVELNKKSPSCEVCPAPQYFDKCYKCRDEMRNERLKAQQIAHTAVKQANLEFYKYSSDDGYGSEHAEFLMEIGYL